MSFASSSLFIHGPAALTTRSKCCAPPCDICKRQPSSSSSIAVTAVNSRAVAPSRQAECSPLEERHVVALSRQLPCNPRPVDPAADDGDSRLFRRRGGRSRGECELLRHA